MSEPPAVGVQRRDQVAEPHSGGQPPVAPLRVRLTVSLGST